MRIEGSIIATYLPVDGSNKAQGASQELIHTVMMQLVDDARPVT